jgi:hypothetical protein
MLLSKHADYYLSVNSTHNNQLAVIFFCLDISIYLNNIFFRCLFLLIIWTGSTENACCKWTSWKRKQTYLKTNYFHLKNVFFLYIFFKYMLMYLTFSNLNSIHWIIKKDIDLYVLFRTLNPTFHDNFQD